MTGEEAMDFYHQAYRSERMNHLDGWHKPFNQKQANINAFQALVDKIESEMTLKLAENYLNR